MNIPRAPFTNSLKNRLGLTLFKLELVKRFWQQRYRAVPGKEIPWAPLRKPVAESTLALITTGGVHLRTDTPFDMSDPDGDPDFRLIPSDAQAYELMITHDYYDHRDADRDPNLIFPWQVVRELTEQGRIGGLTEHFISFMGHIDGPLLNQLIKKTAVDAADRIESMNADIALLVPA